MSYGKVPTPFRHDHRLDHDDYRELDTVTVFVNIYDTGQAYGGPEEGGWFYRYGTLKATYRSECFCPIQDVVSMDWDDDEERVIYQLTETPYGHRPDCPAVILYNTFKEGGDKEAEFLKSYVTANGTYDPNSGEDPPEDYAGELVTGGAQEVRIQTHKGENFPQHRPFYS